MNLRSGRTILAGVHAERGRAGIGVSIVMPNSPEWLFAYFATQKLGACAVPVNVALKREGVGSETWDREARR